jgi:ABC-type glycerol-3-phosphate transport system substrate-binding protein
VTRLPSALAVLFACLASCAKSPVELSFQSYLEPPFVKAAQDLADQYNAAQKRVKVKVLFAVFDPDYSASIDRAFAGGTEADVITFFGSPLKLASAGLLAPLPAEGALAAGLEGRFLPAALANRRLGGTTYGIPLELNVESPSLLLNDSVFADAKVPIPESWIAAGGPPDWEELYALARRLTRIEGGEVKRSGLAVFNRQEESMFLSLIWQYGGDFRDTARKAFRFRTAEARAAIGFMKALLEGPGRIDRYEARNAQDRFTEGDAAMIVGAPWYGPQFATAGFKGFTMLNMPPLVRGAKPYFISEGGWGLVVSARAKHPAAAWDFLVFASSEDSVARFAATVGSVPPLSAARGEGLGPVAAVLGYGRDPGSALGDTAALIWTVVRRNLRSCLQGRISVEEALLAMETESAGLLR